MAVWQFDLNAVCRSRGELLPAELADQAHSFLEDMGLPVSQESEAWTMYEPSDGNRIDVLVDEEGCEISVRIDARSDADRFVTLICTLMLALDCKLYSPELVVVIPAKSAEVKGVLQRSAAWRFALGGTACLG